VGQKVHPKGFRLGVFLDWDARWFARGSYGKEIIEDIQIRKFLQQSLEDAEISRIELEKAGENIKVILHSGRPGVVIGKKGQDIEELRKAIAVRFKKANVEISVQEEERPELNATLVAKNVAEQIEKRTSYKQAMKRAANSAMKSGAKGIKIRCAGRLGGAEIAREEWTRIGAIPLHTLRSNIDYGFAEARTTYGIIGIKVWICKGEFQIV
jgi:small subunit ribosomal protein S3